MGRGLDKVEDLIDSLEGIVEVGSVVEPSVVKQGLTCRLSVQGSRYCGSTSQTNIEIVHAARKRMKTNDDMHVVSLDGVLGDGTEVALLISVVKSGAGEVDPGSVSCGNTKSVNADGSELVDSASVQERSIASLKHRTALGTKSLAECPLIRRIWRILVPPNWVMSLFFLQPTTKVGTIGLVGCPVDELSTVHTGRPGEVMTEACSIDGDRLDWKRALTGEWNNRTAGCGVGTDSDTQATEQGVQVSGGSRKKRAKDGGD